MRGTVTMYHGSQRGWIEVIAGVMFSGKSEELIRRIRRATIARKRVQAFKSHLDDRYGTRSAVARTMGPRWRLGLSRPPTT